MSSAIEQPQANQAEQWCCPIDLSKYERSLVFSEQELLALEEVMKGTWKNPSLPSPLQRFMVPIDEALTLSDANQARCRAARKILLNEMQRRQTPLWAWTHDAWAETLCGSGDAFMQRYSSTALCRQQLLVVAYLLCGFSDFHLVGCIKRDMLASTIFGRTRIETAWQRVAEGMRIWGSTNGKDTTLRCAVCDVLLFNRSPFLEDLTYECLLSLRDRTTVAGTRQALGRLSCALMSLGIFDRILPNIPFPPEKLSKAKPLTEGTSTVAEIWLTYCQRWHETSTLAKETRNKYYCFLLQVGRWLTQQYPDRVHPQEWTREFAATVVAFVNQLSVGEWIEPGNEKKITASKRGKAAGARHRAHILACLRAFFRDCQEWEWINRRFDPGRCLATPRSVRALIGPDPRVLEDDVWAKLLWAGLNLTQDDLIYWTPHARIKNYYKRSTYPLEMVRAMAVVWLFCGLRSDEWCRLRLGCIRWQREDVTIPWTDEVLPKDTVCMLDIPTHKTGTTFTKPVDLVVGEAIAEWEHVRAPQPSQIDSKTGEAVHFLFTHSGRHVSKAYINKYLIPLLCKKSGVPRSDARGNITSHRARSTIATQLFNAAEPMSLFELQEWLGHSQISSTQQYAKVMPTKLAQSKAKAEYFERNLRLIDVLIDQDAVKSGAAATGTPWRYYDLGHGLCTYDFFDTCPHRLACAKCSFYVPKGSSLEQIIEGKTNLLRMKQELTLTDEEVTAVDDGLKALEALQKKLVDVPTPSGPTPSQIQEEHSGSVAFISVQTVQKRSSKNV
jgi:integrase